MRTTIHDEAGDILITKTGKHGCGIVEVIHCSCVIAYFEIRLVDGEPQAEIRSVHDRLTTTKCADSNIMQALRLGQRLADTLVAFNVLDEKV